MSELGRLAPYADLSPPPPAPGEPVMATCVVMVKDDPRTNQTWVRLDNGLDIALEMEDLIPLAHPNRPTVQSIMWEGRARNPLTALGIYLGLHS